MILNNIFVQMVLHFLPELPDGVDLFDDDVQVGDPPCPFMLCPVMLRPVMSCSVLPYPVTLCYVLFCSVLSLLYPLPPYQTQSILGYHVINDD